MFVVLLTEAAGYNPSTQCCKAAPEDTACAGDYQLVQCGEPDFCTYGNTCIAKAAGWSDSDCCPVADESVCTLDDTPQYCGDNKCFYASESCAQAVGYSLSDCCNAPKDVGACTTDINKVVCGNNDCVYENQCIANLAGFDDSQCSLCENEETCCSPNSAACQPACPDNDIGQCDLEP